MPEIWHKQKSGEIPDFKGRVVLVTGASSGIGKQLAKDLNKNGAEVIITARRVEQLEEVKKECQFPEKIHVVQMDLANIEELTQIAKDLNNKFKIDMLINNGGISMRDEFKNLSLKMAKQMMNVNYLSVCALSRYIGEGMVARKSGHIINNVSMAGLFPVPLRTIYSASKYAVKLFSNSARAELRDSGIVVTDVFPGYVQTNISANALVGDGSAFGKIDDNISKGMKVEELSRRILHYSRKNEEQNKGKPSLFKFLFVDYSRLVVDKFYVKLAAILSCLDDDIYKFISQIKYKSQIKVMRKAQ